LTNVAGKIIKAQEEPENALEVVGYFERCVKGY
jgi:hypothetical protein